MYTLFNMHTQSPSAYIWSARLAQDLMGSFIWGKTRKETGGTQVNVTQHFSFIWDITALISQIIFTPACHICYSTLAVNPCDVSICRNRCVSGSRNLSVCQNLTDRMLGVWQRGLLPCERSCEQHTSSCLFSRHVAFYYHHWQRPRTLQNPPPPSILLQLPAKKAILEQCCRWQQAVTIKCSDVGEREN